MGQIRVTPERLEEMASSVARAKGDSERTIQDLTLIIFNLQMQ
ncbi:hypothetical protein [Bacillus sp. CD3-5]|nr:hypothetical protein [Bacillus sp. CD3-5]